MTNPTDQQSVQFPVEKFHFGHLTVLVQTDEDASRLEGFLVDSCPECKGFRVVHIERENNPPRHLCADCGETWEQCHWIQK